MCIARVSDLWFICIWYKFPFAYNFDQNNKIIIIIIPRINYPPITLVGCKMVIIPRIEFHYFTINSRHIADTIFKWVENCKLKKKQQQKYESNTPQTVDDWRSSIQSRRFMQKQIINNYWPFGIFRDLSLIWLS